MVLMLNNLTLARGAICHSRLQLERTERQSKVEVSRLNAEITSLRQRLDRADADLLQSKRENLKLGDEVASLEKEVSFR